MLDGVHRTAGDSGAAFTIDKKSRNTVDGQENRVAEDETKRDHLKNTGKKDFVPSPLAVNYNLKTVNSAVNFVPTFKPTLLKEEAKMMNVDSDRTVKSAGLNITSLRSDGVSLSNYTLDRSAEVELQPNTEDAPQYTVPKFMVDLYNRFSSERYAHPNANIVRSFTRINHDGEQCLLTFRKLEIGKASLSFF